MMATTMRVGRGGVPWPGPATAPGLGLLLGLGLILPACGDPTGPGTNTLLPLAENTLVDGVIAGPGDVVRYRIEARAGLPLRLFFQARSGRQSDNLVAEVVDASDDSVVAYVFSRGTDAEPLGQASPWFAREPGYHVRVRGATEADEGPFSLLLLARDPAPESRPATVALGDTVAGEAIDYRGDLDEFAFHAEGGQEVVVFFQALSGSAGDDLLLDLVDSASGETLRQVFSRGTDAHLESQSTGRFRIPATGTYVARVQSRPIWSEEGRSQGPYRLFLYGVDPTPEGAPAVVAPGEISEIEAIDAVGDVDEFYFTGAVGEELNVLFQSPDGVPDTLVLEVLHQGQVLASTTSPQADSTLDANPTGAFTLPADEQYTVRVSGPPRGPSSDATGRYRFELYRVNRQPESASATIPLGAVGHGERIERPGDVDEYTLVLDEGQDFNVFFTAPGTQSDDGWLLEVLPPEGFPRRCAVVGTMYPPHACHIGSTGHIRAFVAGSYTVRVGPLLPRSTRTGDYRIEVYPISPAPESLPQDVAAGVWIQGEGIDRKGDFDEFHFNGTAGEELVLFARPAPGSDPQFFLQFFPPGASVPNAIARVFPWEPASGRFTLPETGVYTLAVTSMEEPGVGSYEFLVHPVDPAPETASATYVVGDTVATEAIDPIGDRDEFHFDGVEGDSVWIFFEALSEEEELLSFTLQVVNAATGEFLAGVFRNQHPALLVLPSTDRYRINVQAVNNHTGPYVFAVLTSP